VSQHLTGIFRVDKSAAAARRETREAPIRVAERELAAT
jgi:hypothetical protein